MERKMGIEIKMNEESMRMFQEVNINLKKIVELQERNIELMSRFGKGSLEAIKASADFIYCGERHVDCYGAIRFDGNHYKIEGKKIQPNTFVRVYQTKDELIAICNGEEFKLSILEPTTFDSTDLGLTHA